MAKLYGLDADEVYKARWFKGAANKHNVGDNLPKITDRAWVMRQCLSRLAATHEAQRAVLTYGLKETAAAVPVELRVPAATADGDPADHPAALVTAPPLLGVAHRQRLQLLRYLNPNPNPNPNPLQPLTCGSPFVPTLS